MLNCSGCWDNPCTCGKDYSRFTDLDLISQINMLQRLLVSRHPEASVPVALEYPEGMSVHQLKQFVNLLPEQDSDGNDFIIMIRNKNDDELPVKQMTLTETVRQTPEGKPGLQLVLAF